MGLTAPRSSSCREPTGGPLGDACVGLIPRHRSKPSVGHYQRNQEHGQWAAVTYVLFSLSTQHCGEVKASFPAGYSLITLLHLWVRYHEVLSQILLASPSTSSLAKLYLRVSRVESKEGLISRVSWFTSILLSSSPSLHFSVDWKMPSDSLALF